MLEVRNPDAPDGKPIWLLVEREEAFQHDDHDDSLYEATVRLYWELVGPRRRVAGNWFFEGSYSRGFRGGPSVSIATSAVFLDPVELRGLRVGTYLMNEIVLWAKQWSGATVQSIQLVAGQAGEENKERRNRFYERFGLVFDYRDPDRREGRSRPMPVENLVPVETWKANVREWDVRDYFASALSENERLQYKLEQRCRSVENLSAEIKNAEAKPVRWALRRVWWRVAPNLFLGALLLAFGMAGWSAFTGG